MALISFKDFLTESIVIGKPTTDKTYVFVSDLGLKYILLLGDSGVTLNSNDMYILVNYIPTDALYGKIVDIIKRAPIEGKQYYYWSDIIDAEMSKLKFTVNDFVMKAPETKLTLPAGFERIALEAFTKSLNSDNTISLQNVHYGDKVPGAAAARNDSNAELWKKLVIENIKSYKIDKWVYLASGAYVVVDHKAKTIQVVDNTRKYQTRMRSFGKTEYVLPLNDFSINERILTKIVTALCNHDKKYRSYIVPDVYLPVPTNYTAGDITDGIGRIADTAAHFDAKFKTGKSIKVYHGTSNAAWRDIISKQGLRPGKGSEYTDKIKGHSEHLVYFTHSIAEARQYAVRAGAGRGSVVLQVELHDFTKIKFDEDNLFKALKRIPPNVMDVIKVRMLQLWPHEHILSHQNNTEVPMKDKTIEPWALRKLFEGNLSLPQKNLLDFIGGYAVNSTNQTFAYKGNVLPKDIKLVEHFKSTSTSGVDDKYQDKYSKVLQSFKSFTR